MLHIMNRKKWQNPGFSTKAAFLTNGKMTFIGGKAFGR